MTSAIFLAPVKIRGAGLATFGLAGAGKRYLINGYDRFTDDTDFEFVFDFDNFCDFYYCCDEFVYEYSYSYSYTYKYKYEYSYTYKNHCGTTA
jgi:hypothetical protein